VNEIDLRTDDTGRRYFPLSRTARMAHGAIKIDRGSVRRTAVRAAVEIAPEHGYQCGQASVFGRPAGSQPAAVTPSIRDGGTG
jgi:hypothetical protein